MPNRAKEVTNVARKKLHNGNMHVNSNTKALVLVEREREKTNAKAVHTSL